jgi:adenine-specific DNA-methyltransferase
MMVPRLKLLRELLADDGAIFINIENNEHHHLRNLMDEIFGEENFVGILIWRKKEGGGQTDQYFVTEHEYIVAYQKTANFKWQNEIIEVDEESFKREDNNGKFNIVRLAKWGNTARREDRLKMYFPITAPDGKKVNPIAPDGNDGRWRVGKQRMDSLIENDLIYWGKKDNRWVAYEKIYYNGDMIKVIKERSILFDIANTADASKELTALFGKKDVFDNPKPMELIKFFLQYTTDNNSLILDSFAGSGTTMHAVMDLNKEDGGNRKCILVQMTETTAAEPEKNICKDITRERVKRAIDKFGYDSGFQYFKVGIPIDAETLLAGNLPTYRQFAEYVYYLCTGESLKNKSAVNEKTYFVGEKGNSVIYLVYKHNFEKLTGMALNLSLAEKVTAKNPKKKVIVYAPACFLEEDYMNEKNIDYVGIPYNLFQRSGV